MIRVGLVALGLLALVGACGNGSDEPSPSVPVPTPPDIEIPSDQTRLGIAAFTLPLAAHEVYPLTAQQLAGGLGVFAEPCEEMSLYITWQIHEPYPPNGVKIDYYRLTGNRRELIHSGEVDSFTDTACLEMEIVNNSEVEAKVEMRYAFAE